MWHFRCKDCPVKLVERCQTCQVRRFLQDSQAAIDLITWYLDSYHRADLGHRQMLGKLQSIVAVIQQTGQVEESQRAVLREVEQQVDRWLYQTT